MTASPAGGSVARFSSSESAKTSANSWSDMSVSSVRSRRSKCTSREETLLRGSKGYRTHRLLPVPLKLPRALGASFHRSPPPPRDLTLWVYMCTFIRMCMHAGQRPTGVLTQFSALPFEMGTHIFKTGWSGSPKDFCLLSIGVISMYHHAWFILQESWGSELRS